MPFRGFAASGLRLRGCLTKDEAHHEAVRRWHELPPGERQTHVQAQVFAASLADDLDFRTMGNERKVIAAWLVREIDETGEEPSGPDQLEAGEEQDHAEAEDGESAEQFGPPQQRDGDRVVGTGETPG